MKIEEIQHLINDLGYLPFNYHLIVRGTEYEKFEGGRIRNLVTGVSIPVTDLSEAVLYKSVWERVL